MRPEFILLACWFFGPLILALIMLAVWRDPAELPEPPRPVNEGRMRELYRRAAVEVEIAKWENEEDWAA